MSNDATMATKLIRLITDRPGSFAVEIADRLNMDMELAETCLLDLVSLGQITSHMTKAPNGLAARAYTIAGVELPSLQEKAIAAAMPADGKPQTHCEKAVAFILANGGSATSAELHGVLGLKSSEYPSTFLATGVRLGKINKDGQNWTLGKGSPVAAKAGVFNEPINIAKANAAKVAARAPVDTIKHVHVGAGGSVSDNHVLPHCGTMGKVEYIGSPLSDDELRYLHPVDVALPTEAPKVYSGFHHLVTPSHDEPGEAEPSRGELSFAHWSTGEFHIAHNRETIMILSAEELASMLKYLGHE